MDSSKGHVDRVLWEQAALEAFERAGPAAVTVAGLARELGVTKGSFYWHFKSRDELLGAALARWEQEHTIASLDRLAGVKDARQRLTLLFRYALESQWPTLFGRLLVAAPDEPLVEAAVSRATDRRLGFLRDCYRELGMTPRVADRQALLAYSAFIGIAMLTPSGLTPFPNPRARRAYAAHAIDMLVTNAEPN